MKNKFSRFFAGMLAAAVVFTSGTHPVSAKNASDADRMQETDNSISLADYDVFPAEQASDLKAADQSDSMPKVVRGEVEVRITSGIPFQSASAFTVTLKEAAQDKTVSVQNVVLKTQGRDEMSAPSVLASFADLADGEYVLTVAGDGYLNYTQNISVQGLLYRVELSTGNVSKAGGAQRGLLIKGDVNGDGRLDDADAALIADAIETKQQSGPCDLNGDGKVDLLDLNYFTEFRDGMNPQEAQPIKYIPFEAASISQGEGTVIAEGSVDSLSGTGDGVVLKPANGGDISESNPIELAFDFSSVGNADMDGIVFTTPRGGENAVSGGYVTIIYEENGEEKEETVRIDSTQRQVADSSLRADAPSGVTVGANGEICIDLGRMVAVKKVTLTITATSNKKNLAEITKVEFLNDMESRIPEPVMNIPKNLTADAKDKEFVLSWSRESNVTGYEVCISNEGITDYIRTTVTTLNVRQFNKDKLKNNTEYTVSVQSLNGEWRSGYSDTITVTPKATKVPDAPDRVKVTGGYRSITVSWSETEDAETYNIYYKKDGAQEFQKISNITELSHQIEGLEDYTKYLVYVTAVNEIGEGAASLTASDITLDGMTPAKLPEYKLINTSNGEGVLSSHIVSASVPGATMVDSPLDLEDGSGLGLFDNQFTSFLQREDWDYGGAYPAAGKGVIAEFDAVYSIGMITFAEPVDIGSYSYASVFYWDENGNRQAAENVSIQQKTSDSRKYYLIRFSEPVNTSKIQFGVGRYGSSPWRVTISEVRFYEYDSIEQDIMNLYADNLHIVLKDNVTAEVIAQLQQRLDTSDPVSGEFHPLKDALQKELDMAKQLLETPGLNDVVAVNPKITAKKDAGISVGGLNAWQPLGVAAAAGEEIVVYVGYPGMPAGRATDLQLVFTQYHAESGGFFKGIALKAGRNEITVPKISSTEGEKGGALYVSYGGSNEQDAYAVRVSGGTKYPVLNVYGATGEERTQKITAYVEELNNYVAKLQTEHENAHKNSQNLNVAYDYDAKNCIANSTDIVMDQMMYSIPASQVLAGLGAENRETKLADAITAMENMMILFYQHKGLTNSFAEGTDAAVTEKNHLPNRYQNIRYMRMFAGAFMYASGNHIGIEWNETKGMVGGVPVVSSESGKYISGRYFGWGIAHEIGHVLNEGAYSHAEVTNNYFSVLAQAKDSNDTVRFQYPNVFEKVTSGTKGYADNVFTQLGMYWQLHLAYDRDYNYKTYDTYQEITQNLFFARVDSYARNTAAAPAPGNIALTLASDRDQNIMRLASAAAERNLLEFFERWGMTPDEDTKAYAGQFAKEERAIYYVDDAARVYEIENGTETDISGKNVVSAQVTSSGSEVTLTMDISGNKEALQGYEIVRVYTEFGEERKEVAGFTQDGTFSDRMLANRAVIYEVTAIDKCMNRSAVFRADAVKADGDGLQDKSFWKVVTNMVSEDDVTVDATEDLPCEPGKVAASDRMIDDDKATTFTGKTETEDPYIVLELNQPTEVSALRYVNSGSGTAVSDYKIEVSADGETYTSVKEGKFTLTDGSSIVYFENGKDPWICTYDAAYVKLTAVGQAGTELSVSELDLYGPSGDNVEFITSENGVTGIGRLSSDYVYEQSTGEKIPAGSIVFTGAYKGNPAYNMVILYDENGEIVGGVDDSQSLVAQQIILAPETENALLGETSEGRWIYWIEPQHNITLPAKVRAELYRVDNALTNEGQRMVSDTLFAELPAELPAINLTESN